MGFEWDSLKARTNLAKHEVDFADAVAVFEDELALTVDAPGLDEDRHATIGTDALGRTLVIVYTWRGDTIRLISARKATRVERRQYEARR